MPRANRFRFADSYATTGHPPQPYTDRMDVVGFLLVRLGERLAAVMARYR
ncbi:MAG: hypothetical protein M3306_13785 [Actinomycetota bacterium]|nr:hypothetical protein [Actinomycetota bacterium]